MVEHDPDAVHGRFGAGAASRWLAATVEAFSANRTAIDAINVFPVADSDTGTNLLHTLRGSAGAVAASTADATGPSAVLDAAARAAVARARGNSGMILSQLLRGFADALRDTDPVGSVELATALVAGSRHARAAVQDPTEGTMLSVLQAAAGAGAEAAARGTTLAGVCEAALGSAEAALGRTTTQLDVLARAGVVDAGGHGAVLLLAELAAVCGGARQGGGEAAGPARRGVDPAGEGDAAGDGSRPHYGFEVMYRLVDAADDAVPPVRAALAGIGDCVSVVSDGDGNWRVHVHCDDVGAACEAGIAAGVPREVSVTPLPVHSDAELAAASSGTTTARVVVALVDGGRLARLLRAEGAVVVDLAEEAASTAEARSAALYAAIRASGAAAVTVVPQRGDLLAVCSRAAELAEPDHGGTGTVETARRVVVLPAASPTQALAAIAVHDPRRRAADDDIAMAEAAAATRRGVLLVTDQEALTWAGHCLPGDVLGMIDDEVVFVEHGPPALAHALRLVDQLLAAGGELLTALLGADRVEDLAARLRVHVHENHPEVELMTYDADLPGAVLVLGAE